MSSEASESESDAEPSIPSFVTPSKTKNRKKQGSHKTPSSSRSPPRSPPRKRTPTRRDQTLQQYRSEEEGIRDDRIYTVEEGWTNSIREIGVLEVKDKRSDDGRRTLQGRTIIKMCPSWRELQDSYFRLGTNGTNEVVLVRPIVDPLIKNAREELMDELSYRHGMCPSRDEDMMRSMAKVSSKATEDVLLVVDGVKKFTNNEWQGNTSNQYSLKNSRCVIFLEDEKMKKKPCFILSAEIPLEEGVQDVMSSDGEDGQLSDDLRDIEMKLNEMGVDAAGDEGGSKAWSQAW